MHHLIRNKLILSAVCVLACASIHAQTARSGGGGGGGEAQKFMQQYQQVAAEKTSLQNQLQQMKKDLDAAKAELAAAKKERDGLKSRSGGSSAAFAQANAAKVAAEQSLEQSKQKMNDLVSKYRELAQNLKDVEADRTAARKESAERVRAFDSCAEGNLQLYEITQDVLKRYEGIGLFTKTSASEPFTKLTRTRVENLVDQYRTRALELRAKKPGT